MSVNKKKIFNMVAGLSILVMMISVTTYLLNNKMSEVSYACGYSDGVDGCIKYMDSVNKAKMVESFPDHSEIKPLQDKKF